MSRVALIEYITGLLAIYKNASKREKTKLLDQAVVISGRSRRAIHRHLKVVGDKGPQAAVRAISSRGRKADYDIPALLPHVRYLWNSMERISANRMKAAFPLWLDRYQEESFSYELRSQLGTISSSTLERILSKIRAEERPRGLSTTTAAIRQMKMRVPIVAGAHLDVVHPGTIQMDTVAHCGDSAQGPFINSITTVDIASGWTDNAAIYQKKSKVVKLAINDLRKRSPFEWHHVNSDSGSEFINFDVIRLFNPPKTDGEPARPIHFTRSRPYRKNDNCYVEQRNYTHVRELFGYERLEHPDLVELMNDIYKNYWNPLHNYFLPSQKLIEKVRVGSKIKKKHDAPKTPAERLMASDRISESNKEILRQTQRELNPFQLSKGLESKLAEFYSLKRALTEQRRVA